MADQVDVAILIKAKDQASKAFKSIGLSGSKAAKDIDKAFDKAAKELDDADKSVKKVGGSLSKVTSFAKKLIGPLTGIALAFAAFRGVKNVINDFAEFQKGMAEVGTLADFTADQMEMMTRQTLDFSVAFNQTTEDLVKARYDTVSAGFASINEQTILLAESSKAAVGGATDVGTSLDLLTTVLNAYGLEATDANNVNDILFTTVKQGKTTIQEMSATWGAMLPAARAAGASLEEVGALFATITAGGIKSAEATTSIRGAFIALSAPTAEAAKNMDEFGIKLKDTEGNMLPILDVVEQFKGKDLDFIRKMIPDVTAANAILVAANNFETFREKIEAFSPEEMAGATDEAFLKMTKTIDFQLGQISKRWDTFWKSILTGPAGERLAKALADLNKWFDENNEVVNEAVTTLSDLVIVIIDSVGPAIKILNAGVFALKIVWFSALAAIDGFATGVANVWDWLATTTSNVWDAIKLGVLDAVDFIIRSLADTAAGVAEFANEMGISADAVRGMQTALTDSSASVRRMQNDIAGAKREHTEYTSVLGFQQTAFDELGRVISEKFNPTQENTVTILDAVTDSTEKAIEAQEQLTETLEDYDATQPGVDTMEDFIEGMEANVAGPSEVMETALSGLAETASGFDAQGLGNSIGSDLAAGMAAGMGAITGTGQAEFETPGAAASATFVQKQATATGLFSGAGATRAGAQSSYIDFLVSQGLSTGLPNFQRGGIATSPIAGIFGEAGDEALIPLDRLGGLGGVTNNNITFTGPVVGTPSQARLFAREIQTFLDQETDRG